MRTVREIADEVDALFGARWKPGDVPVSRVEFAEEVACRVMAEWVLSGVKVPYESEREAVAE